jgi:uncharacterized membrane protein YjjP (DUF1212 family)
MPENNKHSHAHELGITLLDIATLLMVSGASTERVRNTIDRISNAFEYTTYMLLSQRTIILSVYNDANKCVFNSTKRTAAHGVNFTMVSGISRMSWLVVEEKWTVEKIKEDVARLRALPHYPRIVVLLLTALAGASFCRLATGSWQDMCIVFIGTTAGLFIRQEATKKRFNPYMCVYFAAFTSSLIAGSLVKFDPAVKHEFAFATSVLFLIPGVPLINAFSDMIDGNLQNGLIRGLNGFIISFSIALGLLTSMAIYRF